MRIKMLQDENTIEGRLLMGKVVNIDPGLAYDLCALGVAEFEKEPEPAKEPEPQVYRRRADYGDYSTLTVPQLKEILKGRGWPVGGTKAELIARLTQ